MVRFTLDLARLKDEFPCQDPDDQTDYNYFSPVFINEDCPSSLGRLIGMNGTPHPAGLSSPLRGSQTPERERALPTPEGGASGAEEEEEEETADLVDGANPGRV